MSHSFSFLTLALIALAGVYAGIQNVLAGGGSFITFPALLLMGINPLMANVTSTVAMFPSQLTSAILGRKKALGVGEVSLKYLFWVSLLGGTIGAVLLLITPVSIFTHLVPWLILLATSVFIWGSYGPPPQTDARPQISTFWLMCIQGLIAIYGGYFGGGIGLLMLAALTIAGQSVHTAIASKNILAMVMNAAAVAIFVFSDQVNWLAAGVLGVGGVLGGFIGSWLVPRVSARLLKNLVIVIGLCLTVWMFIKAYAAV